MDTFISVFFLLSPLWLLIGGGLLGRHLEKKHFADIERREVSLSHITLSDLKTVPVGMSVRSGEIVTGSMVVAADYFKSFASSLKTLIGGQMKSLERMQERARREAVLRMVEEAQGLGAKAVMNVRIETSTIAGKRKGSCAGVEVIVSGTALTP
jgi:uncharacterized protein YbjQ (UPF0145 family)